MNQGQGLGRSRTDRWHGPSGTPSAAASHLEGVCSPADSRAAGFQDQPSPSRRNHEATMTSSKTTSF
jgi:hypothetical protein